MEGVLKISVRSSILPGPSPNMFDSKQITCRTIIKYSITVDSSLNVVTKCESMLVAGCGGGRGVRNNY